MIMKSTYVYTALTICSILLLVWVSTRRYTNNIDNKITVISGEQRLFDGVLAQIVPSIKPGKPGDIVCTDNDKTRKGFLREVDYNKTVTIPNNTRLISLTHEEAASLYHRITEGIQTVCQNQIRLGNVGDGGYYVCEEQRPHKPCLVYSFGIRNDFSFDDDVARRYGCEVHSFDPGMGKMSFQHSKQVYFHDTGIAGSNNTKGKWRLLTLNSIRKELNHLNRNIDILKIDTEGAEWDALENMMSTRELGQIPQILLEFHLRGKDKRKEYTREAYIRALGLIREMNRIGYQIFYNLQTWNCEFVSKCSRMKRTNCMDIGFILRSSKQR